MAAIVEQELPTPIYSDFPSVELYVKIIGLGCNTMIERFSIFTHATFLELLKIILSKHMKYGDSSFRVSSHNLSINIENAIKKVKDYYEEDEHGNKHITFCEISMLTPKNDFDKNKNIISVYKLELENAINLHDVEPINQAKPGSWIGFGSGSMKVPLDQDNHIKNLVFIQWTSQVSDELFTYIYNVHALVKLINQNKELLIPHLNVKINSEKFLKAWIRTSTQAEIKASSVFNWFHIIVIDDMFINDF